MVPAELGVGITRHNFEPQEMLQVRGALWLSVKGLTPSFLQRFQECDNNTATVTWTIQHDSLPRGQNASPKIVRLPVVSRSS